MILKRNDLARQFETIVHQEIKKFNDLSLELHMSINALSKSISTLKNGVDFFIPDQENKQHTLQVDFESHKKGVDAVLAEQNALIEGFAFKLGRMSEHFESCLKKHEEVFLEAFDFFKSQEDWKKDLLSVKASVEEKTKEFQEVVSSQQQKFYHEIQKFREEIFNIPDKIPDTKREFDEKLNSAKVDSDGVLKEIRIYKKEIFIIEKKIENLYTLVDRVNRRIESNE